MRRDSNPGLPPNPNFTIRIPFKNPMNNAVNNPAKSEGTIGNPERSSKAITTDDNAQMAPTERSMPPVINTIVNPQARSKSYVINDKTALIFIQSKNDS